MQILLFILAEKKQMYDQSELEADNPGGSQDFHIKSGVETQSWLRQCCSKMSAFSFELWKDVLGKGGQIERERGVYYIQLGISLPSNSFPAGRRPLWSPRAVGSDICYTIHHPSPDTPPSTGSLSLLPQKCHQKSVTKSVSLICPSTRFLWPSCLLISSKVSPQKNWRFPQHCGVSKHWNHSSSHFYMVSKTLSAVVLLACI